MAEIEENTWNNIEHYMKRSFDISVIDYLIDIFIIEEERKLWEMSLRLLNTFKIWKNMKSKLFERTKNTDVCLELESMKNQSM